MVIYPSDWFANKLEEICVPSGLVRGPFGGSLKKSIFVRKGNKVYEQRNAIYKSFRIGDYFIDDDKYTELSRFAVEENDFIISCSGTIGKIYKIPTEAPKGVINQALLKIRLDKNKCDLDYFYIYFQWDKFQSKITDDTQGGAMKNLVGMSVFRNTLIYMPPDIAEQQAIASALSSFDEHIDNLAELIEKKRAIRNGALEDLVSGKTRIDGFDDEWEKGVIGDILTILHGRNQFSVESFSGKYPILGTGGVIGKAAEYLCDWECVLIGRKGTIDNPLYMDTPFWTIDTLYYSRPMQNQSVKFQYYLFCTICWADYAESSGRPSLAKKVIEEIPIRIPSEPEQKAIAQILTEMDDEIESLETERAKMMQVRDGAMDDLLTGRMRLKV